MKPENTTPQEELGIIGLGRMGANLALQAIDRGLGVVGFTLGGVPQSLRTAGVAPADSLAALAGQLRRPRKIFLYIPSGEAVDRLIDELDRSLHSLLTRLFLERFITHAQGGAGQLIFTTHDTNILDFNLLSRDSVGFVEKDINGCSITYPLSELNQRQVDEIVENRGLEAAYLDGRFGAIPFMGIRRRVQT